MIDLLLKWEANPNLKAPDGSIPLTEAASTRSETLARMLLEKTKKVDSEDKNGHTPFVWASKKHHLEVMKLLTSDAKMMHALLMVGANHNALDHVGISARARMEWMKLANSQRGGK
ncbi:hypothetical protein ACJ73_09987 [Blastomyces percursus]|uniref:Uncharacterized protein n=1 Tax=Blastomyces percursus TaxID=1658174 RepID=A0A1J9P2B7_9EURO|nr:hypothetical protein ACJ73_09987 [Blastomyces percursus]